MGEIKRELIFFLISVFVGAALCGALIPLLKKLKAGQTILGYVDNHKGRGFVCFCLFGCFFNCKRQKFAVGVRVDFSFVFVSDSRRDGRFY